MAFNIEEFRAAMFYDGARPNLFQVHIFFPDWLRETVAESEIRFVVNSTQLPQSTVGVARQHYFGREVKFPGDRVFPDWSVNIVNDANFVVKNAIERWLNALNNNSANRRNPVAINNRGYSTDAVIHQLGKAGNILKTYDMYGIFPIQADPINVAWNANDQIEEFGATFAYQYWIDRASNGNESSTPGLPPVQAFNR